jgi:hypothetical protein
VDDVEKAVRSHIEAQAKDAKEKDIGPITVRIVTRSSKVYYVLGEVNAPGSFTLNGRETVLDGILAAGGLTDKASRSNVILARPSPPPSCRTVLPICYREIVQLGDTSTNYQLQPGDRIYVASRTLVEELCPWKQEGVGCCGPQTACPPVQAIAPSIPPPDVPLSLESPR